MSDINNKHSRYFCTSGTIRNSIPYRITKLCMVTLSNETAFSHTEISVYTPMPV